MWLLQLVFLNLALKAHSASWGYTAADGPLTDSWGDPYCKTGLSQSPIDIYNVTKVNNWLPLRFLGYREKIDDIAIFNNGHTIQLNMPETCQSRPRIIQGNLPEEYELAQLHFHWGSKHSKGSEHKLYGEQYPAEVHFVHYKTSCGISLSEALANCGTDPQVLAVVGVFIEIGDHNEAFEPIVDVIDALEFPNKDNPLNLNNIQLRDMLPRQVTEFYRYPGSLTTPVCNELVVWTVMKNTIQMSYQQMSRFWTTKTALSEPLIDNFRPVQPRNDRNVFYADLHLHCHSNSWKTQEQCDIKYRETSESMSFESAVKACVGNQVKHTAFAGLIPVGKLRCLRNRFETNGWNNEHDFCNRYFHVNAVKDETGIWRQYPDGSPVSFSHFPDFNQEQGGRGDSLVWDALKNRLFVGGDEHFNGLCYQGHNYECDNCPGYNQGHECSDAGDCYDSECACDVGFTGHSCQLGPLPDNDIVVVGNIATATTSLAEKANTIAETVCAVTEYESINPNGVSGMYCDFVFGRGICCGGISADGTSTSDICAIYNCNDGTWQEFHDLPLAVSEAASTPIRNKGKDHAWMISGGVVSGTTDVQQSTIFVLERDLKWERIDNPAVTPRSSHCMVQISDCEVALIGGYVDGDLSTSSDTVEIYNFKKNTVKSGPTLVAATTNMACNLIKEKMTDMDKVVIGCGDSDDSVQVWDLETNEVYLSTYTCPADSTGVSQFKRLDDQHLVLTNAVDKLYTFNLIDSFTELATTSADHSDGNAFVAPRGHGKCMPAPTGP